MGHVREGCLEEVAGELVCLFVFMSLNERDSLFRVNCGREGTKGWFKWEVIRLNCG